MRSERKRNTEPRPCQGAGSQPHLNPAEVEERRNSTAPHEEFLYFWIREIDLPVLCLRRCRGHVVDNLAHRLSGGMEHISRLGPSLECTLVSQKLASDSVDLTFQCVCLMRISAHALPVANLKRLHRGDLVQEQLMRGVFWRIAARSIPCGKRGKSVVASERRRTQQANVVTSRRSTATRLRSPYLLLFGASWRFQRRINRGRRA